MITFLSYFLHNPWLLVLGLLALAIPPIIHLLNRRRFDVVDWGAMQFLQISENVRRRLLIEEILLMLLRMGLLGVLVFAIAGLFLPRRIEFMRMSRPPRDVVLIIDGSASMLAAGEGEKAPADLAREWANEYLEDLSPGDAIAVFLAREQPVPIVGQLSVDHARVRNRLADLPAPAGSSNWPEAVRHAAALLAGSQKGDREIIILGDNQRFGWADSDTLFRWELMAGEIAGTSTIRPRIWAIDLASKRPARLPNWALGAVRGNRPVVPVDREVTFQSDILLFGQKEYTPPHRLRLEIDGKAVRDLPPPGGKQGSTLPVPKDGKMPFSFTHRFPRPGSYLVSVILEPDPPADARPHGYEVKDRVPGDNRQDFAVEVLEALPVLIVDGESSAAPPPYRNTDFLRDALSPARDRNPVVKAKVVAVSEFNPELLTAAPRPRVLILHDVARLTEPQTEAITSFLSEGGGVLVTLGHRIEPEWYNQQLYRDGEGWLPARVDSLEGDEAKPAEAMRPDPPTFTHPALELFRGFPVGGLGEAKFLRWWKLTLPGKNAAGVVAGTMRNATMRSPFVVERGFAAGRVLLSSVPLDNTWGTNLTSLTSFVPLAHEMVYYLAGARSADFNLKAGQPIRYRTEEDANLRQFTLQLPVGEPRKLSDMPGERDTYRAQMIPRERGALLVYEGTREAGVYRLTTPEEQTIYYVVPPDGRESDLTPCAEEDREAVKKVVDVRYPADRAEIFRAVSGTEGRTDLWWYLLVGLLALLCLEVWMTRRMVMNR